MQNVRSIAMTLGLALTAAAQDPPAAAAPPPPPVAADAAQSERAAALLRAHGERSRTVKVLLAEFVQRRTTALAKEPLTSRGEFQFVREPAVVVFRTREPRVTIARLTATTYEVHRPQKKQLERFVLDGPELAQGLFAAVGGDAERLLRDFVVTACTDVAGGNGLVAVRLAPKEAAMRERLRELVVTLRGKGAELAAVAYRDAGGDLVEIELAALRIDPKDAPGAALDVPRDTTIVEHAAKTKPR
jgi:hypothetical protein